MAQNQVKSIDNSSNNEEVKAIGFEFAKMYYDAVLGMPDAKPLDQLYNRTSKHQQLWSGREPQEVVGVDNIQNLLARMKFDQCAIAVDKVFTRRPWPTRFTVNTVGRIIHPGREAPRRFTQTTVFVRFAPSENRRSAVGSGRRYLILRTSFRFEDRVKEAEYYAAVGPPKKAEAKDAPKPKPTETNAKVSVGVNTEETVKEEKSMPTPDEPATVKKLSKNMRKKIRKMENARGATEKPVVPEVNRPEAGTVEMETVPLTSGGEDVKREEPKKIGKMESARGATEKPVDPEVNRPEAGTVEMETVPLTSGGEDVKREEPKKKRTGKKAKDNAWISLLSGGTKEPTPSVTTTKDKPKEQPKTLDTPDAKNKSAGRNNMRR